MPENIRVITISKQGPAGPPGAPTGQFTTVTDPAVDAAVTTAIVDANDGVVVTFTSTANSQTIQSPTDTTPGRSFTFVNDDSSTFSGTVNGFSVESGTFRSFIWDSGKWTNTGAGTAGVDSINGKNGIVVLEADEINTTSAGTFTGFPIESILDFFNTDKADLVSPVLTGIPEAPTASPGTNTTQIATTAFSQAAITTLVDGAPSTLDTLNELAAAVADDPNFSATVTTALSGKQPLDATLTAFAALFGAADRLPYFTSADVFALATFTSYGRTLIALSDASALRTNINVADGADVSPVDSVNTQTGAVILDPDDLSDTSTTNKFTTSGDISKLAGIEAGAKTGDVVGPVSVTDGNLAVFDTTTGKLLKDGGPPPVGISYVSTATNLLTAGQNVIGVTDTTTTRTITISTADITNSETIGKDITIKDQSGGAETNNITIDTEGSETIDGLATIKINVDYGVLKIYSNGVNLFVSS